MMHKEIKNANLTFQQNSFGDLYLTDIISAKLASYHYQEFWEQRFSKITYNPNHIYIFTGTDAGLLIKAFANYCNDKPLALIFIEDERYIEAIADECKAELAAMEFAQILTIDQLQEKTDQLVFDADLLSGRTSAIQASCAETDELESYRAIHEQVVYMMESRRWIVMSASVRLPFIKQQLLNIPEMNYSMTSLHDVLNGETVVLLAAGPSLDDHIDWVIQNRESVIVIAVSRISRRLLEKQLTPDFIVHLDPHPVSFEVSHEALSHSPAPILAFSEQAISQIVGQWAGPKVYMGSRVPWKIEKNELKSASLTVSNLAFTLTLMMSPKNIVLLGMDFCLSESGHTHAIGNMEREQGVSLRTDMKEVVTYDGSVRLSSIDYYKSGKQLEEQIAENTDNITVINPAAGAMRMRGVSFIALDEFKPSTQNRQGILDTLRTEITNQNHSDKWTKQALKALWEFRRKMTEFKTLCKKAQTLVARIETSPKDSEKCYRQMDIIDHKIRKNYRAQRNLCTQSCGHFFANALDTGAEKDQYLQKDTLSKSKQIYIAYLDSIKELQTPLDDSQELLQLNSAQTKSSWSQELVDKYLALGLPGKVLNTSMSVPEGAIESAKEMQFVQRKMKTEQLQTALDKMKVSDQSLFQTLNGAYVQRSIDKLMHYKNAILKMKDFHYNAIYSELANAYLAEVLGDNESAMNAYQKIIDQGETPLTEEALNRIAYLCIRTGDSDTALMALTVLSEINPMYLATLEQFRKVA